MKQRFFKLCILCLFCTMLFAGCKNKDQENTANNPNYNAENYLSGKHYVQIDITNYGSIVLELNADAAPATVTNFMNLVQEGFYNGLTFHRIMNGFMMQGGDPEANGLGGSEYTLPGEFALNNFDNPISHVRGTISMARAKDYNSASSQFFIVHQDAITLDGSYAAFGNVISGMDVVDAICAQAVVTDDNGTVDAANQPVMEAVYVLTEEALSSIIQTEPEELPTATATIAFNAIPSTEGLEFADIWNIDEDGKTYLLFSSEKLTGIGIYNIDLSQGIEYDTNAPMAFSSELDSNEYICVKMNIPVEDIPTLVLAAEEPSGAVGLYLIALDANTGDGYLVPILK